jgi:hypothetical protein
MNKTILLLEKCIIFVGIPWTSVTSGAHMFVVFKSLGSKICIDFILDITAKN